MPDGKGFLSCYKSFFIKKKKKKKKQISTWTKILFNAVISIKKISAKIFFFININFESLLYNTPFYAELL